MSKADNQQPRGASQKGDLSGFLARFGLNVPDAMLRQALTHRSYAYEHDSVLHNERLEFLGDSILGQVVTIRLYFEFPDLPEGELAKRRAALVSSAALAEIARSINLGEWLFLGNGEERTGGREKSSILADTMEAIIGAVFLSLGQEAATEFVNQLVEPLMQEPTRFTVALDPKTSLQEIAAQLGEPAPTYHTVGDGPDHNRVFTASVTVGAFSGTGTGTSKKLAEIAAARQACEAFAQDAEN